MLKLGNKSISNLFIGQKAATKAFLGQKLVWQKSTGLPYDAEVEYLESTGTQWIDTGVQYAGDVGYWIQAYVPGPFNDNMTHTLIGAENSYMGGEYVQTYCWHANIFTEASLGYVCSLKQNEKLIATFNFCNDNLMTYIGDVESKTDELYDLDYYDTVDPFTTISLFSMSDHGKAFWFCPAKIYACKISQGTSIVRDFIPVRFTNELSQLEGAMYDCVSKQLFRNQGSGDFIVGHDVA